MATKKVVTTQLLRMAKVHRVKLDRELIDEYYKILSIEFPEDIIAAADWLISKNKFFPKPSEWLMVSEQMLLERVEAQVGKGNANRI